MVEGIANHQDPNAIGLIGIVSVIEIIGIQNKRTESMNVAGIGIKTRVKKEMIEDQTGKEARNVKEKGQKDPAGVIEEKSDQKVDRNLQVPVQVINTRKVKKKRKKRVKRVKKLKLKKK